MVFGPGDFVQLGAELSQEAASPNLEVLLLGGLPIREPVVHYGPFVMNTKEEILQAMEDYQAGRLGQSPHRHCRTVTPETWTSPDLRTPNQAVLSLGSGVMTSRTTLARISGRHT